MRNKNFTLRVFFLFVLLLLYTPPTLHKKLKKRIVNDSDSELFGNGKKSADFRKLLSASKVIESTVQTSKEGDATTKSFASAKTVTPSDLNGTATTIKQNTLVLEESEILRIAPSVSSSSGRGTPRTDEASFQNRSSSSSSSSKSSKSAKSKNTSGSTNTWSLATVSPSSGGSASASANSTTHASANSSGSAYVNTSTSTLSSTTLMTTGTVFETTSISPTEEPAESSIISPIEEPIKSPSVSPSLTKEPVRSPSLTKEPIKSPTTSPKKEHVESPTPPKEPVQSPILTKAPVRSPATSPRGSTQSKQKSDDDDDGGGMSRGAKAGIAVACIIVFILLVSGIVLCVPVRSYLRKMKAQYREIPSEQ